MKASFLAILLLAIGMTSCNPPKKDGGGRQGAVDPRCESKSNREACSGNSSCEWVGTSCSGSSAYCGGFSTQNSCPVSCQWSVGLEKCQKMQSTAPIDNCSSFTSSETCLADATCAWNNISCTKKQLGGGVNPNEPTPSPTPVIPGGPQYDPNNPNNPTPPNQQQFDPQINAQCLQLTFFACLTSTQCTYKLTPLPPHCEQKI